jgi:hypothetical protein
MDWILDHLQLIIAIAGAIAYWLNARNKEQAGEPADYDGDGKPDVHAPPAGRSMREHADTMEADEATRRIQEEIRRKIAERQGGGGYQPPPPYVPSPSDVLTPAELQARERRQAAEARREEAEQEAAEVLKRQRGLEAQLAELKARREAEQREAKTVWMPEAKPGRAAATAEARDDLGLLGELRDARSLRKAIVLREVLGTPVGLR